MKRKGGRRLRGNRILKVEKETLEEVIFSSVQIRDLQKVDLVVSEINSIFKKICEERDTLIVSIMGNSYSENIAYDDYSKGFEVKEVVDELLEALDPEDAVKMSVRIEKKNLGNNISVYSLENFGVYVRFLIGTNEPKTLEQMISFAVKYLFFGEVQKFTLITDQANFSSRAFVFSSKNDGITQQEKELTSERIIHGDEREKHCNLIFEGAVNFTPDDFYLITQENINENIKEFFDSVSLFLSMIFLADTIKVKDNILEYKIYGYRNMHKSKSLLDIENLSRISRDFFSIYQWSYEQNSNVSERIGMTRNVLSLFTNGDDIFTSSESALPSIKSSFEIYLKENVDKYIEVLNQVVLLLNDLKKQSIEIANSYTQDFKNNFIALFTFLVSTILFNTISSDGIENIFTEDITHITLAFLLISVVYWLISRAELNKKIEKLENNYKRNKDYYKPILDSADIERIFNSTQYLDEDKKSIKDTEKLINILWLSSLGVLFVMVFLIGDSPIFETIKDYLHLLWTQIVNNISEMWVINTSWKSLIS